MKETYQDPEADYKLGLHLGREQALDELWEWLEIEVVCNKPNPVVKQIADKIIQMRKSRPATIHRGVVKT